MWRSLAMTAVAVLLGASAGCGGGESASEAGSQDGVQQYCRSLRQAQQEFGALESGQLSGANLKRLFSQMHRIADQAPPAVADEWQTLDRGISRLQAGLEDLGLGLNDLSDPSKLSEVDPQKLQRFSRQMQDIGGREFQQAGNRIERHARQECGIKLGQSGRG